MPPDAPREPPEPLTPVEWIGAARDDLRALPGPVRAALGHALFRVQEGKHPRGAKRLTGALRGLLELRDDFNTDTYRAVLAVQLAGVIYVLHVFRKKSTHGIGLAKRDLAVIQHRWQRAKRLHALHAAHHGAHGGTP